MKTLFLDCGMGAAGDMLAGALLGVLPDADREQVVAELNGLALPGVEVACGPASSHGLAGWHFAVKIHGLEEDGAHASHAHPHSHAHLTLAEVEAIIGGLGLEEEVRREVVAVYRSLAEAEGEVHGATPGEVHFHEVGMLDAIMDIAAVCTLVARIGADRVAATPVHVGSGTVRCAHGVLPVPAPATAVLLRGIPAYAGEVQGELCTPTGAALLRHFVREFGPMPPLRAVRTGIGIGTRDVGRPSAVRAVLGVEREPEKA